MPDPTPPALIPLITPTIQGTFDDYNPYDLLQDQVDMNAKNARLTPSPLPPNPPILQSQKALIPKSNSQELLPESNLALRPDMRSRSLEPCIEDVNESDYEKMKSNVNAEESTMEEFEPTTSWKEFEPTTSWKEVGDDQILPPGLHVRMDLETGKKEARLMGDA
jgi:hypothetical protein